MSNVSVIGLGPMGIALAQALISAGHNVTVWNRTASKAEPLIKDGAALAPSVASAVGASPVVIVCVADYAASHSLLSAEGGRIWGENDPGGGAVFTLAVPAESRMTSSPEPDLPS